MPKWIDELLKTYANQIAQSRIHVTLIAAHDHAFDISAASARTCYSSKGILFPDDMQKTEKARELRQKVTRSTLKSGHHTTRQHAHFVFGIENVSRQIIWQILHAHPYYNSEQVSQRYVKIKDDKLWYNLPSSLAHLDTVHDFHRTAYHHYTDLIAQLTPLVEKYYFEVHRLKARNKDLYKDAIQKKAMEVARYVMPLSTSAYLYHTVSALTLLRYARMLLWNQNEEFIILGLKIFELIKGVDLDLYEELPEPIAAPQRSWDIQQAKQFKAIFDQRLDGKPAKLIADNRGIYESLEALSPYNPSYQIESIIDNQKNLLLGDVFYPGTLDAKTRLLNHLHFTFAKKLSHTADSQEQRHRTLPGNRPELASQFTFEEDYIIPRLISEDNALTATYRKIMSANFKFIQQLSNERKIELSELMYLLPNAFPVRYFESGDYFNFFHKWKSRLCYNAQEEIFYSAHAEVSDVIKIFPQFASHLGPPCVIREHLKPRCPEGDHFCGIKVWQIPLNDYNRIL